MDKSESEDDQDGEGFLNDCPLNRAPGMSQAQESRESPGQVFRKAYSRSGNGRRKACEKGNPAAQEPEKGMKMPAPIMLAMTMLVTGKSPSFLSSPFSVLASFIVPWLQDAISPYPIRFHAPKATTKASWS